MAKANATTRTVVENLTLELSGEEAEVLLGLLNHVATGLTKEDEALYRIWQAFPESMRDEVYGTFRLTDNLRDRNEFTASLERITG